MTASETLRCLDGIADAINPLLGLCLLLAPFFIRRSQPARFSLRAWSAIALVYLLAHFPRWLNLFGKHPFPSGHFAFALCAATSLAWLERRFLWVLAPLLAFYGALILRLAPLYHHTPLDLAGATFAVPLTIWLHRRARVDSVFSA